MRARRFVPSPALVIACLALALVSAGPVAGVVRTVATNSVGTAQLKNGAVTTPKLRDGAVTNRKIAPGTITGSRIADQTVGVADLAPGARPVLPQGLHASEDLVDTPSDGSFITVVGLDLPAGSWLLVGKAVADTRADSSSGEAVICHLFQGDVSLDFAQSYAQVGQIAQQYFTGSLPLTAAIAVAAPTRVELRCAESNDALDAVVRATKLVAVQVRP